VKAAPQQINLYQPIFRVERKLFSAKAMLYSLALIAAGLLVVWAFGWRQVGLIEAEVERLKVAEQRRVDMTARQGSLSPAASLADVERRSADLVTRLGSVRRALELTRADGGAPGFAARLEALGAPAGSDLWLDRIVLGRAGVALHGGTTNAAAVPRYLGDLGRLPAFAGAAFDRLTLQPPAEAGRAGLEFEVGSEAALALARARDEQMRAREVAR
jgi:hypothetical protein